MERASVFIPWKTGEIMDNPTTMIKFLVHYTVWGFATLGNIAATSPYLAAVSVRLGAAGYAFKSGDTTTAGSINSLILQGLRSCHHQLIYTGIQIEQITRTGEVGPAFANISD
jgi:hypothetical protein